VIGISRRNPAGKVVSCELEAGQPGLSEVGGGPASQPLLPRRVPRQVLVRPVMNDPDILRRIRDGLRDLSHCWAGLLSSRVDSQGETLRATTHRSDDGHFDAMIVYAGASNQQGEWTTGGSEDTDSTYR
jgi:hypothetical protein